MDRFNFFFRQKVTEGELDSAFDAIEDALFNWALDNGVVGVTTGGVVTENAGTPNMTVDVSGPATIYDQTGQRISWSPTQDVDCTVDENSNSTAVTTPGNSKWITIFAQFKRVLSDPRLDGTGASVYFSRAEGFELHVAQGAEAVTPTRPAARADEILLADVLLTFGMTQIFNADIDDSRREWAIRTSGATNAVAVGTVEEAVQSLADHLDAGDTDLADHIAAAASQHLASAVDYAGGGAWHDGTTNPAATVEAQLDKLVSDLVAAAGSDRVGSAAATSGATSIGAGSVYDQIVELLGEIEAGAEQGGVLNALNFTRMADVTGGAGALRVRGVDVRFSDGVAQVPVWCAVADDGATSSAFTTDNPLETWTARAFGAAHDRARAVVWADAETLWVAVGRTSAAAGAMAESAASTAAAWTDRSANLPATLTAAGDELRDVIYDAASGYFIACGVGGGGTAGAVARTADGTAAWASPTTLPTTADLFCLAHDGNGTILCGGEKAAGSAILRSIDGGDTWTEVLANTDGAGRYFTDLVWEPRAERWVGLTIDGDVWVSTNAVGTAWAMRSVNMDDWNESIATDGRGLLLATGSASMRVAFSRDLGVTWGLHYLGNAGDFSNERTLFYLAGLYLQGDAANRDLLVSLIGGPGAIRS